MVSDLKRLSPHLTGKPCAVKVARTVWRGLCLREGTRLPYERSLRWPNEEDSRPSLKRKLFLRHSRVKVHRFPNCVDVITSAQTNSQSGSVNSLRLIWPRKEEEIHLNDSGNIIEARDRIGHFITQVYHQKRPHSALGYLTPIEFQRNNLS